MKNILNKAENMANELLTKPITQEIIFLTIATLQDIVVIAQKDLGIYEEPKLAKIIKLYP